MQNFIIIILSISLASAQFSIVDKQIYNISDNMYYSENEFINLLNSDSNFANDKDFLNYKKYASRLNFKKSKYIYLFSLLSIFTGIDGIQNPEEHVDDDSPPGLKNIIVGCLLSSTYYGYNSVKKTKSLYKIIYKYNENNVDAKSNYNNQSQKELSKKYNTYSWNNSVTYGFLSEKTLVSIIEYSGILNINKQSECYLAIGSMLFGSGIGLGYKYYFNDKINSSPFISIGSQYSYLGTAGDGMAIYGLSISPGYSKEFGSKSNSGIYYRDRFGGPQKEVLLQKSSMNFGLSFLFFGDGSFGALPFINIEKRF